MDYLGISNEPKLVAQPEAKDMKQKTKYAGTTWVRGENGILRPENYDSPKDKHQFHEDTAGGRKERANLKGIKTDIFGYPEKKVAPLRDYEIAHAKTNWGLSASENLENIDALKKSSENHTLRDYEIAHA